MSCPRCGWNLPQKLALAHCPRCGQPLYAPLPLDDPSVRVTKVITEPRAEQTATTFDNVVWPDLDTPLQLPDVLMPLPSSQDKLSTSPTQQLTQQVTQRVRQLLTPSTWSRAKTWLLTNRRLMAVLGLALVLALLTGSMGYLVSRQSNSNFGHSSLAHKQSTATHAPTASSTATHAPTATATRAISPTQGPQLVTLFSDPLTSNTNGWPSQNGCGFQSDGYHAIGGSWCIAPVPAQSDTVNISVQIKFPQSTFGGAGIGFRIQNGQVSQSYRFFISANGACSATDQQNENDFFNTTCPAVHQGANAVNTLAITQNGAHMDFYINGTLVGSGNDGTFSAGQIALATEGRHTNAIFANFTLTKWE